MAVPLLKRNFALVPTFVTTYLDPLHIPKMKFCTLLRVRRLNDARPRFCLIRARGPRG